LNGTVQFGLNAHNIGFKASQGSDPDVLARTTLLLWLTFAGNVVTEHRALAANIASSGHKKPLHENSWQAS